MPQLRQDPTTKEWVIIAAERSKRPHDFKKTETLTEKPPYKEDCPFCQGNEHLTPHESLAYRSGGQADSKGWWVRVIPNKFPALSPEGSLEREETGFFRMMDGVGIHEVVIESPIHNQLLPLMEDTQVEEVLLAYRERYLALREDPRIKLIIVGTSVVPSNIRKKLEGQPAITMTTGGVSIAIQLGRNLETYSCIHSLLLVAIIILCQPVWQRIGL